MKTVLICGGRDFNDWILFSRTLNKILIDEKKWVVNDEFQMPSVKIVNGGYTGADTLATEYAVVNWLPLEVYYPDWGAHGKAAGPIRNQQMLDEEDVDLVVAFPGDRGTADMVRRAKKANIEVIEIESE